MRTVAIVQARMSSTRLPGKVMRQLAGRPVLDWVLERVAGAAGVDDVWVATTDDSSDDIIASHLEATGVPAVRGSLDDVLSRYGMAAEAAEADVIVRITSDCPLIDPAVISRVVSGFQDGSPVDYCSNTMHRSYPIGMDTEVFGRPALETALHCAHLPHEREHVTPYIYQHPEKFTLRNVLATPELTWPDLRLTLDEPADLEMLSALLLRVRPHAGLSELLEALKAEPELTSINQHVAHRYVTNGD